MTSSRDENAPDFIASLAAFLAADPLREKLLLAPSHRAGRQWLDRAAAIAGGFANVRAITLRRFVLDMAEPALRRRGLRPPSAEEKIRLVGTAIGELAAERRDTGYFTRLPPSLNLAETLLFSLEELEGAMIRGGAGLARKITPPEKAEELAGLVRKYRAALGKAKLAGVGDIHTAAMAALAEPECGVPLLLVPDSIREDCTAAEQIFLAAWPKGAIQPLAEGDTDSRNEFSFFVADAIANEAREVFRILQSLDLPLDAAEVVCTDLVAYVPALCAAALETFGGRPEDLPVTFNGGIPGAYARPVRLLSAWLEWLEGGTPPEGLARMLDAELLGQGWRERSPGISANALAARLRALPLGGEPGEYRRRLGAETRNAELAAAETWLARLLPDILPLANGGEQVDTTDADAVLDAAEKLLLLPNRHDGKLDAYARTALLEAIRQWRPHTGWPGFDPLAWLTELTGSLHVMGLGPLPGRLHVGDLTAGGHSGREYTFILGLDDGRHPGSTRQDPVLLDRERAALSPRLPKSGVWRRRREKALARLLRLPGKIFLSYARHDTDGEREAFPATVFIDLAKRRRGKGETSGVSLVPERREKCLNHRDDWLAALLAAPQNHLTPGELAPWFPHLAEGAKALAARASRRFTGYDGNVPDAGRDFFQNGQAVSPTDLEVLAGCPLEFFFKRILGVKPPDRYDPTPGRWLEGNVRGSLLHDVFQEFLIRLEHSGGKVEKETIAEHSRSLERLLASALEREKRKNPPRDPLAGRREEMELAEACGIFLESEIRRQAEGRPLYMEVSLGGDRIETPWDRAEPVDLTLESGLTLKLRGRMDRIDRLEGGGLFITDYKSGRSDKFSANDPFRQGRNLQPLLYTRMLERALADLGRPEPVRGFAYYFPMPRDEGRIIAYSREELDRTGMEIVEKLGGMAAAGCFPFTTDPGDVRFSDYAAAFGNVDALTALAREKALTDPALAEWAALRGLDHD